MLALVKALLSSQAFHTIHPNHLVGVSGDEAMAVFETFDSMLAALESAPLDRLAKLAMIIDSVLPSLPSSLTQRLIVTIAERDLSALEQMSAAQMILKKIRHGVDLAAILDARRLARIAADLQSATVR